MPLGSPTTLRMCRMAWCLKVWMMTSLIVKMCVKRLATHDESEEELVGCCWDGFQ